MSLAETPLVGLVEEALLPGEGRTFLRTVIAGSLASLRPDVPLCAVTVATAAEVPSLVASRWATECTLVSMDEREVTLRGTRRVRITSVSTRDGAPFAALVPADDVSDRAVRDASDPRLEAIRACGNALVAGAAILASDAGPALDEASRGLLRAATTPEQRRTMLDKPIAGALSEAAAALSRRAEAEQAGRVLESVLRTIPPVENGSPPLPRAVQHKLWSQVIEVQRRLDIYDPDHKIEDHDTVARLQKKLMQAGLPRVAREVAKRELRLLRTLKTDHHDFGTYTSHLELMARLPWHPDPTEPPDLPSVARVLARSHSGLDKVKRRILEYLAVRRSGGHSGTVLCLAGPPGVGKTTIARAIAEALGRPFVRIALGGVHDESEIRGFRLSYVAAGPGRIVAGFARAGSASCVVLLDELDKLGTDRARSPFAALLEVLDAEQNREFHDNFLAVPYDLSHAFFIATANELDEIHPTLRDRLEVMELEGYTPGEKRQIARAQLLPALTTEHGLKTPLSLDDATLDAVIQGYTREPGVRQLRRELEAVHRHRVLEAALNPATHDATRAIDSEELHTALGVPKFRARTLPLSLATGTALGLSVGGAGGAVLFVEARTHTGDSAVMVTGRAGEVLRESAQAALSLLRSDPARFGLDAANVARAWHVHLPDGATPKDGPSAGLAIFIAMVSAASDRPVLADVAMTGEITLSGDVLPVGGIRAKVLAAARAGARRVIIPADNEHEVPPEPGIEVTFVRHAHEALAFAFASDRDDGSRSLR